MQKVAAPDLSHTAPSGARSSALLVAASVVAIGFNYVFLVAAARILGTQDYGTLAALLGLLTVALLPTGAIQLAISREVSWRLAIGDTAGADAFGWAALRLGLLATPALVVLGLILANPLREILNIESTSIVALTTVAFASVFVFPIATGVLQGYQRFTAVAAILIAPFALRLGFLVIAALAGYRLGGAVLATVAASISAAGLAIAIARRPLRHGITATRPSLGPFLHYLWPVAVAVLGIAVLTNFDLLIVKARFSSEDAGEYAAASAFARVAFFLPATILAVLFPRTAARQARGDDTADILGRSLLATASLGVLLTLFYAMSGRGLVHTSFGAEFAEGGELLVLFTISMTIFALANVLVGFHLSRGEVLYAWTVAGVVPVQLLLLTLFPSDLRGVIWANIGVGIGLLLAHELFVESSVPALRAGWRHLLQGIELRRKVVSETVLTLLGATVFVTALMWPLASRIGSAFLGGERSDASAAIAWLWRIEDSGYHIFGTTERAIEGLPIGWEESNGENLHVLLAYYPAYLATKVIGEIAAYNLVVLSGFVLSGAAMYLLTRYLGCNRLVAAWAGMVYVIFPWHIERGVHGSLTHLEVLVLLVLAVMAAAERPSWTRITLVGLATLSGWLTTGYLGAMAAIAAVAFAITAAIALEGWSRRFRFVAGTAALAFTASILVAALSIAAGFGRGEALGRSVLSLSAFGLRLTELVVPSASNIVVGDRLESFNARRMHGSLVEETSNYLGLLTILLASAWFVLAWRGRARLPGRVRIATAGLSGLVVTGLAFALPSPVILLGYEWTWTPSRILWEVVPAFRVPTRWIALVMTALIPLAAFTLQAAGVALRRRCTARFTSRVAPVVLIAVAMLVSILELTVSPTEELFKAERVPPRYQAVNRAPFGTLAEYPLVRLSDYAFWQRVHGRPLLNEIPPASTAEDVRVDDIRHVLVDPGAPGTASHLSLLGIRTIVTYRRALDFTEEALFFDDDVPDFPDARWGDGYELVARLPNQSSVWRVVAAPAPALVTLPGGFGEPRPPIERARLKRGKNGVLRDSRRVGYPLVQGAGVGYLEFRARKRGAVRLLFDVTAPRGTRRSLRIADAQVERAFNLSERTRVTVMVFLPRGVSRLVIKTDPAPTSEEDAIVLSAPRVERAVGQPEVRADLVSVDPGF